MMNVVFDSAKLAKIYEIYDKSAATFGYGSLLCMCNPQNEMLGAWETKRLKIKNETTSGIHPLYNS